jgi:hypothetical protein
MSTRFATTGPEGPQLGPDDAANLREQFTALLADVAAIRSGTHLISAPGLCIGTSAAEKVKVVDFRFAIGGVPELKASAEVAFTATTHDIASDKQAIFTVSIAAGGTITLTKGDDATAGEAVAPATPAGELKIGEVSVTTVGDTFDATTDSLAETWITTVYTDATALAATASALTAS